MLRTHTCGELRIKDVQQRVTLTGWVQRQRDKGSLLWIDLRDRYGITQLFLEEGKSAPKLLETARAVGREYVVRVTGIVVERMSKNDKMPTGDIEIKVEEFDILNPSKVPPFTIEENTDGGDDLRMKYRYLDLRRAPVRDSLLLRHQMSQQTRAYMDSLGFIEVETPVLIKSTPEGARDFVVPSRIHHGEFYALPQSPQTFKQLLMVSGFDRYYQIVRCFRDEDLRADRQPEFTQIDCEMAFVTREDILHTFEGLIRHLFKKVKGYDLPALPHMSYADAMKNYGSDKPDTRFGMTFTELNSQTQGKGFQVFDSAELVVGISVPGAAGYTRKQLDELTEFVKRPQVGAKGLVWVRYEESGTLKSSVDKFYDEAALKTWAAACSAKPGDLLLVLAGPTDATRKALSELRLLMGSQLGLRDKNTFSALWVIDFPLFEWDEDAKRFNAMHHPFTSPKHEDLHLLDKDPAKVRANAYDMVINGSEVGGGSIRIHDRPTQQLMFSKLGFTEEEARKQFGFLMEAFEFGAPPHGGIAFGFDRLCAIFGGAESIRDFIAFPKNNAGKDMMIDTPSTISQDQLNELALSIKPAK
ncbi:MAG: aspartate--tRNA ligase [Cyclobacteriaceae bacterium]|nr:aspartate--tRNA ligase [Cyclobacteriaceae bacterium]